MGATPHAVHKKRETMWGLVGIQMNVPQGGVQDTNGVLCYGQCRSFILKEAILGN